MEEKKKKDLILKGDSIKFTTSTQENFYRSSTKLSNTQTNFTKKEIYSNSIQSLKNDINSVSNSVTDYSDVLIFYKNNKNIANYPVQVIAKIKDIDSNKNQNANDLIDLITIESQNVEKLMENYSAKNPNELIGRLGLQVSLFDLYVKKLGDLFFLLNVRYNNDKGLFNEKVYQGNLSRYDTMKEIIERLIKMSSSISSNVDKPKSKFEELNLKKEIQFEFVSKKITENKTLITDIESTSNMSFSNLEDFLSNHINDNKLSQIQSLCRNGFEEISEKLKNLIENYGKTKSSASNKFYEKAIENSDFLKEVLQNKENLIKSLECDEANVNKSEEERQKSFLELHNAFEKEKATIIKEKDRVIQNLKNFLDENNKNLIKIKGLEENSKNNFLEEIRDISNKNADLNEKYYLLVDEHNLLKRNYDELSRRIKMGADFESYESLMIEQFDLMKKSFTKKVEELNSEIYELKCSTRKKVYNLEEELKQSNYLKDIFLKQISELKIFGKN